MKAGIHPEYNRNHRDLQLRQQLHHPFHHEARPCTWKSVPPAIPSTPASRRSSTPPAVSRNSARSTASPRSDPALLGSKRQPRLPFLFQTSPPHEPHPAAPISSGSSCSPCSGPSTAWSDGMPGSRRKRWPWRRSWIGWKERCRRGLRPRRSTPCLAGLLAEATAGFWGYSRTAPACPAACSRCIALLFTG